MGKKLRRMTLLCGLPEDTLFKSARVTMMGRSSVLVEGQCSLVELSDGRIRLRTRCGVVVIEGRALFLREMTGEAAMIQGECIVSAAYIG